MKSRNGVSRNFKMTITNKTTGVRTHHTFSFKHQALEESTNEKWIYDEFDDGSIEQQLLQLRYFFKIDWSELIEGEDADKLQIVRNAEMQGHLLTLTPHIDIPIRHFDVVSVKSNGEQEIIFAQSFNGSNSPGNKGTVILYQSLKTFNSWEIINPFNQQGNTTLGRRRLTA